MTDAVMTLAGGKTRFADIVYSQIINGGEQEGGESEEEIKDRLKNKLNRIRG